ncbi:unnamed protein product [Protopolystoma xenopodis]|uniref:Uncharacterized protein n=1 Tax=Protopolystoma xenopodis TaxID=117903 RepID=A0A448WZD0_9PLAT|nr:unnamed protein product [Protopolystoma xenopodis]
MSPSDRQLVDILTFLNDDFEKLYLVAGHFGRFFSAMRYYLWMGLFYCFSLFACGKICCNLSPDSVRVVCGQKWGDIRFAFVHAFVCTCQLVQHMSFETVLSCPVLLRCSDAVAVSDMSSIPR